MIEAKPYLLKNEIMNYAWGGRNENAFIPKLLGMSVEVDTPYAELWMGAHPKAPSVIVEKNLDLYQLSREDADVVLGQRCIEKFGKKFPYLFKVLSADEALSIQAHPNKQQAEMLHEKDAEHYPDDNHKPEIAIALSSLKALVGFKSFENLLLMFEENAPIAEFIGDDLVSTFQRCNTDEEKRCQLKLIYTQFMTKAIQDPAKYEIAVNQLSEQVQNKKKKTDVDHLFLEMLQKYGAQDVGLFALYFLNLVHLKSGEAVFLKAGIPHAYVKGNIIECMANSDNVVRAGLTPKFKDVETLVEILTYEMGEVEKYQTAEGKIESLYTPPVDDFYVSQIRLEPDQQYKVEHNESPLILLVTEGDVQLSSQVESHLTVSKGQVVFIPANLSEFALLSGNSGSQSFIAGVCIK